jgi:hypothetical protein
MEKVCALVLWSGGGLEGGSAGLQRAAAWQPKSGSKEAQPRGRLEGALCALHLTASFVGARSTTRSELRSGGLQQTTCEG